MILVDMVLEMDITKAFKMEVLLCICMLDKIGLGVAGGFLVIWILMAIVF